MGRALRGKISTRWPEGTVYKEYLTVNGSTPAILQGGEYATLTDNGVGDYTLGLSYPATQLLHASVAPIGLTATHGQIAAISASSINVLCFDMAGAAVDATFLLELTLAKTDKAY